MIRTFLSQMGILVTNKWGLRIAQIGIILLGVTIFGLCIWLLPALLVWAINELLEQGGVTYQIAWNFWSWLAGLGLLVVLNGKSK